jgi:hypothetical protein
MHVAKYQNRIERLARSSRPFGEIEDIIDAAPLTGDQKAALWLLAWSYQDRRSQRRIAHETLAATAD